MSVTAPPPTSGAEVEPDDLGSDSPGRSALDAPAGTRMLSLESLLDRAQGAGRWLAALLAALVVFSVFLLVKGADPIEVYEAMWTSASADGFGETLIRATPLLLAGLAVAVPARAGLFNIGGEGQLLIGAVGAMLVSRTIGADTGGITGMVLIAIGGAIGGALWAAIPALLRVYLKTNEAITSLLLNYVAALILTWLVFEPWKDPQSLGQAYSGRFGDGQMLPIVWGNRVHAGIFIAATAAVLIWVLLRSTRWGFRLTVLGGNPEAARRAGLTVGGLTVGAMVVGGALGGLGGAVEVVGVEGRLRPDIMLGFGFIGFLASWLVRHDPLKLIASSAMLAAIAVGGSGLKISSGLSGGAVNVLMALVLLAVLGWGQRKEVDT